MLGRRALAVLAFSALAILSTQAAGPTPDNDHLTAVWVAESHGVLKLSASDERTLCKLPERKGADAVAVDERGALLWTYADDHLRAYSFGCVQQSDTRVDLHDDDARLAIHQRDGSVWLGAGHRLLHLDATGKLKTTLKLKDKLRGLVVDGARQRVWIAGEHRVSGLSEAGAFVSEIRLGRHEEARDLKLDEATGALWLATHESVLRLHEDGTRSLAIPFHHAERLAGDNLGGVWIASERSVQHVAADGRVTIDLRPFDHKWFGQRIEAMESDPADGSLWVASNQTLAHYDTDGKLLHRFPDHDRDRHPHHHPGFGYHIRALALYTDRVAPDLAVTAPPANGYVNTARPEFQIAYSDDGIGVDTTTLMARRGGAELPLECQVSETKATCVPETSLGEGKTTLLFTVKDFAGNRSEEVEHTVTVDTIAPAIAITSPADGSYTNLATVTVAASISEAADVTLNGGAVFLNPANGFSREWPLTEGPNALVIAAADNAGNPASAKVTVHLDTAAPAIPNLALITALVNPDGTVTISGGMGSVEPGTQVVIRNDRTGETVTVFANADGTFTVTVAGQPGDAFSITAKDQAGNTSPPSTVSLTPPGSQPIPGYVPPDPARLAPALDPTIPTTVFDATEFLYSGSQPVQYGVNPGTIEAKRVAVLRGKALTRDGAPLPGVTITVLDHTEFGWTGTRLDGMFDLVANGGGYLTVVYEKDGYLPVQRQVRAAWSDYMWLPDVVMLPLDQVVTTVSLSADVVHGQVARGSVVTDASGSRQATIFFPAGTRATMTLADGSAVPLVTAHVRATEYTVGPTGPQAMPGPLPPTSAYTYAVELSVDEAIAAKAKSVNFTQPVPFYVDNFLNLPVGEIVPVGWYDTERAVWIPSENGRVITILSNSDGLSELAVTRTGTVATPDELASLGITDSERRELAQLYPVGKSLWRSRATHFTPFDCNLPFLPPKGAQPPTADLPKLEERDKPEDPTNCPGCVIEAETQVLRESLPVTGTPHTLNYRSDRAKGYLPARTVTIPVSGAEVSTVLDSIGLEIRIAGQYFEQRFVPAANLQYRFTWDGNDALGRPVYGPTRMSYKLSYRYKAVYSYSAGMGRAFARSGTGVGFAGDWDRGTIDITREQTVLLTAHHPSAGLGGWSLTPHHYYSNLDKQLHQGDGTWHGLHQEIIGTAVGNGSGLGLGDGLPATDAYISYARGIAVAPDGSLYFSDTAKNRIRRVGTDGIITTVAGTGEYGYSGDGGPARAASLSGPHGVAIAPDQSVYVCDYSNHRVRRIGTDGVITTVAGTGYFGGNTGDNGPATQADISPVDIAFGPDGSYYISSQNRVRRVDPDGTIITIAGVDESGYSGDGGLAISARLFMPRGLAVDGGGNVYIADNLNNRIRKVSPDGMIETVAGNGQSETIRRPWGLALRPDGGLYIAQFDSSKVRLLSPSGIVSTPVGGHSSWGARGDGGPPSQAWVSGVSAIAYGPDEYLYISDQNRIRRVRPAEHHLVAGEYMVPSSDGAEYYVFSAEDRHVRSIDSVTGALLHSFTYDERGRLRSVGDRHGNETVIERDASGRNVTIIAPGGQRTVLTIDEHGHLSTVTNPADETYVPSHTRDGLLTKVRKPTEAESAYSYDGAGRLIRDRDPVGGGWTLERLILEDGSETSMISAEGATHRFGIQRTSETEVLRRSVAPDGTTATRRVITSDTAITEVSVAADGTERSTTSKADPRVGMQSPRVTEESITTPAGLVLSSHVTHGVALSDSTDLLSLLSASETVAVNGRSFRSLYDAESRLWTGTSAEGRSTVVHLDPRGMPLSTQYADLSPVSYSYDTQGRVSTVTEGSGSEARLTAYLYDETGNLEQVTDPAGRTATMSYDAAGRVITQSMPGGGVVQYTYDANGNLASLTPPGRVAHVFEYTPVDLEKSYTPPALDGVDTITRYTYNKDKQLTRIERPDGKVVGLDYYEPSGKPKAVNFSRGQIGYSYYPTKGQLESITAPGQTLTYTWDGFLPLSETATGEVSGTVSRTYDNNFWVKSISVNGDAVSYEYDDDGLVTKAGEMSITRDPETGLITDTVLGVVTTHREYTRFGELKSEVARANGNDVFATSYERDALGRITGKTETVEGVTTVYAYHYDPAGRLDEVKTNGEITASYRYDDNGNRLSKWTPNGEEVGTYDAQDRMLTYAGASYEYTENGELKSKTENGATTHYTYDEMGNLVQVRLPGDVVIDYVIDGRNRRVGKKVDGKLVQGLLYGDQLEPIAELDGGGNLVALFVYGTMTHVPDLMAKDGKHYRILSDHLGSPRLVVDAATGDVVQRVVYDESGKALLDSSPGWQPFGFGGGLHEHRNGITRFGARDYDPKTGAWLSKDPVRFDGGSPNLYGYVLADPVNWIDPNGLAEIPNPNGIVPGGPWTQAGKGQLPGDFFGPKQPSGPRAMCRWVPPNSDTGSDGYWKTKTPDGWQRYDQNGTPRGPEALHPGNMQRPPSWGGRVGLAIGLLLYSEPAY